MGSEIQSETNQGVASIRLIAPLWTSPAETGPDRRLSPRVARGIAGGLMGVVDLALLSGALVYYALWAVLARPAVNPLALLSMRMSVAHFCMLAFCWMLWRSIFFYCGLYTWQHLQSIPGLVGRVLLATGLCAMTQAQVIAVQWHHGHLLRLVVYIWSVTAMGALLARLGMGAFAVYVRPCLRRERNVVIVGAGDVPHLVSELREHIEWKYNILGLVETAAAEEQARALPTLGSIANLEEVLMQQVVDEVIVSLPVKSHYATIERVIEVCERVGVQVQYAHDLFDVSWSSHCHHADKDRSKVVLKMVHEDYRHCIKRGLDIAGALFGLIVFAPLFLVVAILIKATSRGPVLFRQQRRGLGKRIFWIYKFRTMVQDAEAAQSQLEHLNQNSGPVFKIFNDPRVTRVGAFLRRTSIDELPQLINVLKGEMSLVGPRPLNLRDVNRFSQAWLMRRFSVKPGLTCLWQISGRSHVSFDRWIELDLQYIDHWSLRLDLEILALTLPAVLKGTGAA